MKLIDIHTHVYPDAIAPKAADSIREFYQLGDDAMDGKVQTLLENGTKAGIERTLIEQMQGVTYHAVSSGKLRRSGFITSLATIATSRTKIKSKTIKI